MIFHQNKRDLHLQPSSVHTYFCVTFYEKVVLIVLNVMLYFRNIFIDMMLYVKIKLIILLNEKAKAVNLEQLITRSYYVVLLELWYICQLIKSINRIQQFFLHW